MADYLLLKVFGFPYEVNQADGKVSAVVPPGFFRNDSGGGSSVHGAGGSGAGAGHGSGAACSSAADGAADGSFRLVTVWRENVSRSGWERLLHHIASCWASLLASRATIMLGSSIACPAMLASATCSYVAAPCCSALRPVLGYQATGKPGDCSEVATCAFQAPL